MSDQKEMSEGHSVRGTEKTYNDLYLSECIEQCGPIINTSAVSDSSPGNYQSESHPSSERASPRPAAMEVSGERDKSEDRCLSGASSEPAVPPQGAAGGPGSAGVMAKMMMMMMSSSETVTPESSVPDMMSMLKEGGMPLPNMSMMSEDSLPAMMGKGGMKGGPMEMARIFDCIIDMSLARDDSDDSEDEGESASPELPCEYCHRFFSSHMALKTHILVAHDQDDSVLNLTQLTISNKGDNLKNGSQRSRKQSWNTEVFASSVNVKTSKQNSGSDLAAAESVNVRGVKRGRIESKDKETVETGGASGVEDHICEEHEQLPSTSQLESSPLSGVIETSGSSGSTFRESGSQSQYVPMETASQFKSKRSKAKHPMQNSSTNDGGISKSKDEDSSVIKPCVPVSFQDAVNKKLKTEMKNVVAGHKGRSSGSKSSVDAVKGTQNPHAAAAAGPSEAADSPTFGRRSLRSRNLDF